MDAMDLELKLSDVTVTAIPLKSSSQLHQQQQQQQQQQQKVSQQQQMQQQLLLQQQQLQMQLNSLNASALSSSAGGVSYLPNTSGLSKYGQLLAVIEEMGRDIRPTYSGSRTSAERLKRGIVHARILVRECLLETERSSARN